MSAAGTQRSRRVRALPPEPALGRLLAEIRACRAPSCGVCAHLAECFGNEDGPALGTLSVSAHL